MNWTNFKFLLLNILFICNVSASDLIEPVSEKRNVSLTKITSEEQLYKYFNRSEIDFSKNPDVLNKPAYAVDSTSALFLQFSPLDVFCDVRSLTGTGSISSACCISR